MQYLTIENGGMTPDKLLEASTPAARKIEIHRMSVADGVVTMRPVEGGLTIPPEGMVTLCARRRASDADRSRRYRSTRACEFPCPCSSSVPA